MFGKWFLENYFLRDKHDLSIFTYWGIKNIKQIQIALISKYILFVFKILLFIIEYKYQTNWL